MFALNDIDNMITISWCIFYINLNPTILSNEDQDVAFNLSLNDKIVSISIVYASTS